METSRRNAALIGGGLLLAMSGLWFALLHPSAPANDSRMSTRSASHRLLRARPPIESTLATTSANSDRIEANAADLYRQAFQFMETLSDDEKEVFRHWKEPVEAAAATELCAKIRSMANLTHEAVGTTKCDWGLDNATESTPLTYLAEARGLTRAVLWHAAHCRAGDVAGMGDDLEAVLRAGSNMSQNLVGYLAEISIGSAAADYVSENAHLLSHDAAARLAKLFGAERYEEAFYRAMELEAQKDRRSADIYARQPAEKLARLAAVLSEASGVPVDQARLVAGYRKVAELELEYVRVSQLSEKEYVAWIDQLHALQQADPLIKFMCPDLGQLEEGTRAAVVKSAMVTAGLTMLNEGRGDLPNHLDPTSGKPYLYRAVENGFELESSYERSGKPMVVFFRTR